MKAFRPEPISKIGFEIFTRIRRSGDLSADVQACVAWQAGTFFEAHTRRESVQEMQRGMDPQNAEKRHKMFLRWVLLSVLLLITSTAFSQTPSPLHVEGDRVADAEGRTVILRGCVTITHDGPGSPVIYTDADYARLKSWGANYQSIRIFAANIGAWGAQPLPFILKNFLDTMDTMVTRAKKAGIYTQFKLTMYGSLTFTWEKFWDNAQGEHDQLIKGWKNIWNRYKNEPAVIGYDLLNEPEKSKTISVSDSAFTCNHLAPLYRKIIDSLRVTDTSKIAMIQPGLGQLGYISFPCPIGKPSVIYAPHFYVKLSYPDTAGYKARILRYKTEAILHGAPLLIGEFGVPWNAVNDGNTAEESSHALTEKATMALFDSLMTGFSRPWFSDDDAQVNAYFNWALIRGTTGLGGTERKFIIDVISRPYPQRMAGSLRAFFHNDTSKESAIQYLADPAKSPTEIFIPRRRHYNDSLIVRYNKLVLYIPPSSGIFNVLENPEQVNTANLIWNDTTEILKIWEEISDSVTIIISRHYNPVITDATTIGQNKNSFQVYPNPFPEEVVIRAGLSLPANSYRMNIYDIKGQLLYTEILPGVDIIKTGHRLLPGIYTIELTHSSDRHLFRIVKCNWQSSP